MEKICPVRKGHSSVADPDLQIRGKGGGGGGLKIRRGRPSGPLPWIQHCLPTRATQGGSTFHTFPFKTWRTVYMRNKSRLV